MAEDAVAADHEDAAARQRRAREEALERLLLQAEAEQALLEDDDEVEEGAGDDADNNNDNPPAAEGMLNDNNLGAPMNIPLPPQTPPKPARWSYTTTSFCLAAGTLWYALRTREQWYLALVFLGGSKLAYCIFGNAMIAACVVAFDGITRFFLGGLRVHEAEGLQDFFRWNVTETCLALTMFRQELTVPVALRFLGLVLLKCLHTVALLREQHLRMTDDAVQSSVYHDRIPIVPLHHVKVLLLLCLLQSLDLVALQYTADDLLTKGPSVSILFAFEAAILLVSAWSCVLLWYIHLMDGLLHFGHDKHYHLGQILLHPWKEYKATLTFAVELQAQAVQFVFYLAFFGFVMTYYGMPINLFREVYVSFMALKDRLWAFAKYRRLMAGMNRFETPTTEQLDTAGHVCIICRDEMTLHDAKILPGCGHIFHKSCLREWLTQQQTCPTCRSDIAALQARQAAAEAAQQRVQGAGDGGDNDDAVAPANQTEQDESERVIPVRARLDSVTEEGTATVPEHPPQNADQSASGDVAHPTPVLKRSSVGRERDGRSGSFSPLDPLPPPDQAALNIGLPFPALYRVVHERGAVVWNLDENFPRALRRVPLGTVVFASDIQQHTVREDLVLDHVRLPDGWVNANKVLRIYDDWTADN